MKIHSPHTELDAPRRGRKTWLRAILPVTSLSLVLLYQVNKSWLSSSRNEAVLPQTTAFEWSKIAPSVSLNFAACYDGLECARLDVPLDWTAASEARARRAAIAIARLPARVPVTDPRYGGAVLINPGGPGGSGVSFVSRVGEDIRTIVDADLNPNEASTDDNGKYFDVIGFDPRGVNYSTPSASCFPDDTTAQAWTLLAQAQGIPFSNESFTNSWGRSTSMAKSCAWRLGSTAEDVLEIGKYMSTPSVVEDMVAITEALGEWREAEAARLHDKGIADDIAMRERTRWRRGEEKLQYWGFSYGTLLGATFAAMHPERIERVILDGVVDADDYYAGRWMANLQDTDSIIESFFAECYAAGPKKCALFAAAGARKIAETYHGIFKELLSGPIPVPAHGTFGPDIITYHDAMTSVRGALYSPRKDFSRLARVIYNLSMGDGTEIAASKQMLRPVACHAPTCDNKPWSPACYDHSLPIFSQGASTAIVCSDGQDMRSWTQADHQAKWVKLMSQSYSLGGFWSEITMPCSHWSLRPSWNFSLDISATSTAHPILWLSNTRDPVTPLRNAVKMSKRFGGSVVFGQDADGHCTMAQPSECVAKGVRLYFQQGTLPVGEIVCKPDRGPFDPVEDEKGLDSEPGLSMAIRRLARGFGHEAFPLGI